MTQIPPAALYADTMITPDHRWTRVRDIHGEYEWEHVPCFQFTYPDGRTCWADTLSPEQAEAMERQAGAGSHAAGSHALGDVISPALDELITANGY